MTRLIISLLLLALMGTAHAHQLKAAITTVLFNDRTQNIEVMHRFYVHDAEHAVSEIFNKQADLILDKATQQNFADYIEQQFKLNTIQGKELQLDSVGYQIDGKFFWVYQEITIPKSVTGLRMSNGALRELWPSQVNMVNVEGKGNVKTLTFSGNDTWLETLFDKD